MTLPSSAEKTWHLADGCSSLNHRRVAACLTLIGMASLAVVSLYQIGVLKRLPEPKLPLLNAEKVNGSSEAYAILGVPDAFLGIASYAATLGLIAMGGSDRARTQPWLPVTLVAKSALDTTQAAFMTRKSWMNFRAFSLYSLITVASTFLVLPFTFGEAWTAWRSLINKHKPEPTHAPHTFVVQ